MKTKPNNPENENGLIHLIKVGSLIRLKKVKEMLTFIIHLVWFCNVIGHWNRTVFSKVFLWSYILEVKAYHLEKLSCIVKIIL